MSSREYAKEIKIHLDKSAVRINRSKLNEIVENCFSFITELGRYLSKNEREFLKEKVNSKAIP